MRIRVIALGALLLGAPVLFANETADKVAKDDLTQVVSNDAAINADQMNNDANTPNLEEGSSADYRRWGRYGYGRGYGRGYGYGFGWGGWNGWNLGNWGWSYPYYYLPSLTGWWF